jgi:hypothetical protein
MNEEQQRIWGYLTTHAVERNNTKRVSDLATHLGYMSNGTNNDNVRMGYFYLQMIYKGKRLLDS